MRERQNQDDDGTYKWGDPRRVSDKLAFGVISGSGRGAARDLEFIWVINGSVPQARCRRHLARTRGFPVISYFGTN